MAHRSPIKKLKDLGVQKNTQHLRTIFLKEFDVCIVWTTPPFPLLSTTLVAIKPGTLTRSVVSLEFHDLL